MTIANIVTAYCILDASSLIHLWDNYPPQHPYLAPFWLNWLAPKFAEEKIVISETAKRESFLKFPETQEWLQKNNINITTYPLLAEDRTFVKEIEKKLTIDVKGYHVKGVNENDLRIIAVAHRLQYTIITEESEQSPKPENNKTRYRIPAVCELCNVKYTNVQNLIQSETYP